MSGVRAVFASLAFVGIAAAIAVTCSITPLAVAADATIEAESMKVTPASGASTVRDSTASGGVALVLKAAATASITVALPASASVVVRAKGQQCNGAPTMNLLVDGKAISTVKVSSSSWAAYTTPTTIAAGSHTIGVAFTNPYRFFCTRSLSLDRVTIVASAPSTTTTSAPTTTSPPTTTTAPPSGDTTAWLQSKFDALRSGDTLTLAPGTYQHSGVLKLRSAGVRIDGGGATLQATNDATSSVQILADNVAVSNLNLTAPLTGTRYDAADQQRLFIQGNGVSISDVSITGSAAAGVLIYGASNFTLTRVTVRNTRADGIHMTNGANNGKVINAVTQATGDDGVAVVSYGTEPICHDIVIESPRVNGTTNGRGITVVGGQNISYRNIAVSQSNAAAVYIAAEGSPWNTNSVSNVDVTGGTVTGANTNTQVVHGAVLVYSGSANRSVTGVTISGLTISNTPTSAYRNVGIVVDAGSVNRIAFNNIALQNTQAVPFAKTSNVAAGSYTTSGWTLNGAPITVN
ncbi:carbohydrate-binding domain-containing protein [Mycolicibacterium stellerae]|uniref:carbohydrate-binding domain-containing protein n=1 Tax=Mycolicibacterium stellerae TaxID=2358193 RepID=UPI000F0B2492|nr:carbohydrate-binding domain-containing protein [Mycolicibacterium stellerae]